MSKSVFLRITCPRCRHHHIVFSKASVTARCLQCNCQLNKTTGGKVRMRSHVKEALLWN